MARRWRKEASGQVFVLPMREAARQGSSRGEAMGLPSQLRLVARAGSSHNASQNMPVAMGRGMGK